MKRNRSVYLVIALCLALGACTGLLRKYGTIDPNREVTAAFERYEVNPDYRYYISGSDYAPNAIMGLKRGLPLDPETLWKEVDMTPARMKEFVDAMKAKTGQLFQQVFGFEMKDNQGRPIGVWYSILVARSSVKMQEDGTVRIDTPDLDTYDELKRDGGGDRDK